MTTQRTTQERAFDERLAYAALLGRAADVHIDSMIELIVRAQADFDRPGSGLNAMICHDLNAAYSTNAAAVETHGACLTADRRDPIKFSIAPTNETGDESRVVVVGDIPATCELIASLCEYLTGKLLLLRGGDIEEFERRALGAAMDATAVAFEAMAHVGGELPAGVKLPKARVDAQAETGRVLMQAVAVKRAILQAEGEVRQ